MAIFNLTSYKWTYFYNNEVQKQSNLDDLVPFITIESYTPIRRNAPFNLAGEFQKLLEPQIYQGLQNFFNGTGLTPATNYIGQNFIIDLLNRGTVSFAENMAKAFINTAALEKSYEVYFKNLFLGAKGPINTFEIPCFDPFFFNSDGIAGWSDRWLSSYENYVQGAKSVLSDIYGRNYPFQPSWNIGDSANNSGQLSFSILLINDDDAAIKSNLGFILSLGMEPLWGQFAELQQPPNVFKVKMKDRFIWEWAAMSVNVTTAGKIRKHPTLGLVPDLYKLTVTIKNLCPANLNSYLHFIKENDLANKIPSLSDSSNRQNAYSQGLIDNMKKDTSKVPDKTTSWSSKFIPEIFRNKG